MSVAVKTLCFTSKILTSAPVCLVKMVLLVWIKSTHTDAIASQVMQVQIVKQVSKELLLMLIYRFHCQTVLGLMS